MAHTPVAELQVVPDEAVPLPSDSAAPLWTALAGSDSAYSKPSPTGMGSSRR